MSSSLIETRTSAFFNIAALLVVVVLGATACSAQTQDLAVGDDATSSVASTPDSTTAPSTTAEVVSGESASVSTTTIAIEDDGYPWIFPSPTLSWYEDGCPSPEDVAGNFMSNFFNDSAPVLTSLSASASPDERRFVVHSRGEGGVPMDGGTVLTFERISLDIVDCAAWVIVSAESDHVVIDEIGFFHDETVPGYVLDVSGRGVGFEALIEIRAHDESFRMVADGYGMGGSFEVQSFTGRALFTADPLDANLMVIATSSSVADGAIPQFAARKVLIPEELCCDELAAELEPFDVGPALAVIDVEADDILNVRSGPGVEHDVVATLSPFAVGVPILDNAVIDGWVFVQDPVSGVEGWIHRGFTTEVENSTDPELWDAVFLVREALSLNAPHARLTDVLAHQNSSSIVVSADAYFSDEDQVITLEELGNAGFEGDTTRTWGYTDGRGLPIEATIEEYFEGFALSPALADTDRIAVDFRITDSNTIDNMAERFPNATIVELHYDGGTGEAADFAWSTLRLGFEEGDSGYRLVAIAGDSWTI